MFRDIVAPLDGSSLAECAIGPAGRIEDMRLVRAEAERRARATGDTIMADASR